MSVGPNRLAMQKTNDASQVWSGMKWIGLLVGLWLLTTPGLAQIRNRQTLEKEKRQNMEKIAQLRAVLNQTASQKQVGLGQLKVLNEQISAQAKQINLLTEDLQLMNVEVKELRQAANALTADLVRLREEYARMIVAADRRRQQSSPLGFLFSAKNVNQLVARYRYLRQYANARRGQVQQMQQVQAQLVAKQRATEQKRKQQNNTLIVKKGEGEKLVALKEQQSKTVAELSQRETELSTELAESRRNIAQLERLIAGIIEREARERAERERLARLERERLIKAEADRRAAERKRALAEATAAGKPAPPPVKAPEPEEIAAGPDERRNTNLSREEATLASSFTASKQRLPWPVSHGFVSDRFGRKPHPVLKGIMVENMGIDIQTNAGEAVRSVYDGVVRDVTSIPGMNTVVAVQHGIYTTVYAKLRGASVQIGQRVKARDAIGTVATNREGISEVQFQIWKSYSRLNPETWLAPR